MARVDDQTIPIPRSSTAPQIEGRQQLDGLWYGMRFTFNARDRRWYMDVMTDGGEALVTGRRVVSGVALLGDQQDARLPAGQIFVEDARGLGEAPDRDAWQSWATMYYRPESIMLLAADTTDEVF